MRTRKTVIIKQLESRIVSQSKHISGLNDTIAQQDDTIARQTARIDELIKQMNSIKKSVSKGITQIYADVFEPVNPPPS